MLREHPKWIKDAYGSMPLLTFSMDALGASEMVIGFHAHGALLKPQSARGAYSVISERMITLALQVMA